MELNALFKASAIAAALTLAGCGGDININEGDINEGDTINENPCYDCVIDNGGDDSSGGDNGGDDGSSGDSNGPNIPDDVQNAFEAGAATDVTNDAEFADVAAQNPDKTIYRISADLVGTNLAGASKMPGTQDATITSAEVSLTNDAIWVLDGRVAVGEDNADSATLYIQEGTTVVGTQGEDFLVVRRGSKLQAVGNAGEPIVMTSIEDASGGEVGIGQWGGLVLLGNAPSNQCDANGDNLTSDDELAGCSLDAEGNAGVYGGNQPEDNSGTLKYVVVKHAGNALSSGDELNGISFAGVGSGTTVDYIQVHQNLDDGIEFFGGNVDVKHVVLTENGDDSLDWAFGWQGSAQHVFIQHSDTTANRGFESDNNEDAPASEPVSKPRVSNVTIVGSAAGDSEGVLLRHGTAGNLHNFVVTGPSAMGECLELDDFAETGANADDGELTMDHSIIACDNGENFKGGTGTQTTEEWFLAQQGNQTFNSSASLQLASNFWPEDDSPVLNNGVDASSVDSRFDSTSHIGAFDGITNWMANWTVATPEVASVATAMELGLATEDTSYDLDKPVYAINEDVVFTDDVKLTNDAYWKLNGRTAVGEDNASSATLHIEAGTTVFGAQGEDFLVVRRGSKIQAVGSVNAPITLTSEEDVTGEAVDIGQWGGLVLLGNAPSNQCDANGDGSADDSELAGCALDAEGNAGVYGGNQPEDNSGILKYVVVKHAGNALAAGDELNGISFAGVGSGTTVDYIQVHQNLDDGVEFFGGTVNVKHLVLTENGDDSMDWAFGWTGKAQYVLVKHSDTTANRGFESDNNENAPASTPVSNPTVANVTVIGSSAADSEGVLLRHGTAGSLHNFIVTGPASMGECLELDDFAETGANADNGDLVMTHSVIACENGENFKGSTNTQTTEEWFMAQEGNQTGSTMADVVDDYMTATDMTAKDMSQLDNFFQQTDKVGAVPGSDWTSGWVTVGLSD